MSKFDSTVLYFVLFYGWLSECTQSCRERRPKFTPTTTGATFGPSDSSLKSLLLMSFAARVNENAKCNGRRIVKRRDGGWVAKEGGEKKRRIMMMASSFFLVFV